MDQINIEGTWQTIFRLPYLDTALAFGWRPRNMKYPCQLLQERRRTLSIKRKHRGYNAFIVFRHLPYCFVDIQEPSMQRWT